MDLGEPISLILGKHIRSEAGLLSFDHFRGYAEDKDQQRRKKAFHAHGYRATEAGSRIQEPYSYEEEP